MPTVVIRDPEPSDYVFRALAGDIDGDRRADLISIGTMTNTTTMKFYWGRDDWKISGRRPDRSIVVGDPVSDQAQFSYLVDCDGDNIRDIVRPGLRICRSGSGKNARTRSWTEPDADIWLRGPGAGLTRAGRPGFLNSRRYEMVAAMTSEYSVLFSGGPAGPDIAYDAFINRRNSDYKGREIYTPLRDVDGDGWDDVIDGNPDYIDLQNTRGIAVIYAGGPYIPSDDPSAGVRQVALDNQSAALSLWPNPVREELNIAWRGDLKQMPRRFEIHDMLGRRIAGGEVPDGDGAAIWRSNGQPSGAYLLSVFDDSGVLLVSEPFVKQ